MHPKLVSVAAAQGNNFETKLRVLACGAESMTDVPSCSVDAVVCTLVLCSVPDPSQAVQEVVRVLKPGGRFIFMEHVCASRTRHGAWPVFVQRALVASGMWALFGDGCQLTRHTEQTVRQASGWERVECERVELSHAPSFMAPHIIGVAYKASS